MGATPSAIARFVMRPALAWIVAGLAVGLAGAAMASRVVSGVMFGVAAADPAAYLGAALILGGVALLACWVPARRASRIDPLTALRDE
jgi:putative ABC transport system permease protein